MKAPPFAIPKDCGHRLLPVLVDELAANEPHKVFISVGRTGDAKDGFIDVTFGAFARAINRCAWWIEGTLGRDSSFQTLFTYLEPQDLRHAVLIFAAIKTGYKVKFWISQCSMLTD